MPPVAVFQPWELWLAFTVLLASLGTVGLILATATRALSPRRSLGIAVGAVLLVMMAVGCGSLTYTDYARAQTWTFSYRVEATPNGTASEAVVVPVPSNEDLIRNLHVVSGDANWSLVSTAHGRGLYLAFAGPATIEASVPGLPPSYPRSEYLPSMAENLTNFRAEVWAYGSAAGGVEIRLGIHYWLLHDYVGPGWSTREIVFTPPP